MPKAYVSIWSNDKAAEMVKFYKGIFKDCKVGKFSYWGKNPMGVKEGSVLTAHITILGQKIMLLNGFVEMPFNESFSMVVPCKTQSEIDYYWKSWLPAEAAMCSAVGLSISSECAGKLLRLSLINGTRQRIKPRKTR